MIFVFGSNEAGRHGKGAALHAKRFHGAKNGVGNGPQGNAYGIPTKDKNLETLPLKEIDAYIGEFVAYAKAHPELTFQVTQVGCGLAGFKGFQIAKSFAFFNPPPNCQFDSRWKQWLPNNPSWGAK